jgi:PhnB protein
VARPQATDQFYGDRSGLFDDPWGHRWNVSTHVEDLSPEEMGERAKAAMG